MPCLPFLPIKTISAVRSQISRQSSSSSSLVASQSAQAKKNSQTISKKDLPFSWKSHPALPKKPLLISQTSATIRFHELHHRTNRKHFTVFVFNDWKPGMVDYSLDHNYPHSPRPACSSEHEAAGCDSQKAQSY